MTELLTSAQMRAIEAAAIASGQVTGLDLMERAGRGVVEAVLAEWPELAEGVHRVVVLCGPGNNGGDGFVVARLLKGRGWAVEVFLYGNPERLPPDARANYERWCEVGGVRDLADFTGRGAGHDLGVDALFGTGLARELPQGFSEKLKWFGITNPVVSVDVPSGLCADSGKIVGNIHVDADLTVTFQFPKLGQFLADGPATCGKVVSCDIGLKRHEALAALGVYPAREGQPRRPDWTGVAHDLTRYQFEYDQQLHSSPLGKKSGHKYTHGHALILSGPPGHGGAARLSARGALRIGAGLVTLGCPPEAIPENAARLDAVMLRQVEGGAGLVGVLEDRRINALCLGPGLGISDETRALTAQGLKSGRACVLDADALTLIARDAALFAALHDRCVLAPHGGEFARLFPDIAERLAAPATTGPAYSKVDATREAAARAGCTVLYKGPDTVIASPDGRAAVNSAAYDRAAPWLATAGSGDVLAGFIAGLLARGFGPFDAACTAAWLHVECAQSFGPGLIAEDLPEELPKVFRALGM